MTRNDVSHTERAAPARRPRGPPVTKTPSASKADFAYEALREQIIDGTHATGGRLVLERIAHSLGISSFPVREAIRRLESEGLVEYRKNFGAVVVGIDPFEFRLIMESTALLEGYATATAAPRLTGGDIARATLLNDKMRSLQGAEWDPLRFTELNGQFHATLFFPCPNTEILSMLSRENARLTTVRRSTFSFIPERVESSVSEHEELLRLLGSDPQCIERIEQRARQHKLNTLHHFLEHVT